MDYFCTYEMRKKLERRTQILFIFLFMDPIDARSKKLILPLASHRNKMKIENSNLTMITHNRREVLFNITERIERDLWHTYLIEFSFCSQLTFFLS